MGFLYVLALLLQPVLRGFGGSKGTTTKDCVTWPPVLPPC